ncbi:Ig-like domain-containing protein [Hyalangium gracile]|uniref:Ig-like domain-containing protein n=1 Tax=Hyalangium gracile TaxID=394092 RepID=UPI001CCE8199|nr:Ig-like domain-containing protein [Hyalangium gracile]
MRFILSAVLLCAASLFTGCSEPLACTEIFIPAVSVTVKDAQGNVLKDARVTYSLDGAAMKDASCINSEMGGGCAQWSTPDQPGDYLVRATSSDGSRTAEQRLQVDGDECHAIGQSMTLTLR